MSEIVFPSSLFRYRRIGRYFEEELRRAVNGQQIYMPLTSSVNDPFDLAPVASVSPIPEILADLKRKHQNRRIIGRGRYSELTGQSIDRSIWRRVTKELRPSIRAASEENRVALKILNDLRLKSRLACFSETNESAPMWAHYAGHDGICLRYDLVRTPSELLKFYPLPVTYAVERPEITTMQLRDFTERSANRMSGEARNKVFNSLFLTKDLAWSYEREWRIVDIEVSPPRYERVEALRVSAMYFGINAEDRLVKKIVEEFRGRIALFEAKVHSHKYGFDFRRIE